MDASVTSTKKRTEYPTNNTDNDCPPKRASKTIDLKTSHDTWHKAQHECVDNQNEETESQQNQRGAQDQEYRTNERIENAKQKRGANQRPNGVVTNPVDNRCCHHYSHRGGNPTKDEVSHGPI